MYESVFGLTGLPFQLSPDPSFYFDSQGHREALSKLRKGLADGAKLMVVTGEIGAGKTTVLRTLLEDVDQDAVAMVHIAGTHLDEETLADTIGIALGLPPAEGAVGRSEELIATLVQSARPMLLVIDEAQHLSAGALSLLTALANGAAAASVQLQVCLLGQPELRSLLNAAEQIRFRGQIRIECHLGPLDRGEIRSYIEHRLRKVGWTGRPGFDDEAFGALFECTKGIPRRLNTLCNRLMLSAFLTSRLSIDAPEVARVAAAQLAEFDPQAPAQSATEFFFDRSEPEEVTAGSGDASSAAALAESSRTVLGPVPPGALLCVAGGQADQAQLAALLEAFRKHPSLPPAYLVNAYRDSAPATEREFAAGPGDETASFIRLDVDAVSYEKRMAELGPRFKSVIDAHRPTAVVVCNGSDAALACGQVAQQADVPVIHIGAGQRTVRRSSAEDFRRMVIDQLSSALLTSEPEATNALLEEGIPQARIQCVGNLVMDALRATLSALSAKKEPPARHLVPTAFLADRHGYGLVWIGAAGHAEDRPQLQAISALLAEVSRDMPLIWPVNKATVRFIEPLELTGLTESARIVIMPTQPHATFIDMMRNATCVLTDSWCVQEEALGLSVPCVMLGSRGERFGSALSGSTVQVGISRLAACRAVWEIVYNGGAVPSLPRAWDGNTAGRIAELVAVMCDRRNSVAQV